MENNLIAGNTGAQSPDIYGSVASSDHDLIGTISGYTLIHRTGDQLGASPGLAPLGNYGGPTQTMPLLPGSPGIDTGDPASGNLPLSLPGLARLVQRARATRPTSAEVPITPHHPPVSASRLV